MAAAYPLSEQDREAQRARAAELMSQCKEDDRLWRRTVIAAVTIGVGSWGMGLFLLSWAVHTTSAGFGAIAFWAGLLIGNVGVVGALFWLGVQVEKQGR